MRYKELDSLRGLAALTVLASHFSGVFPGAFEDTSMSGMLGMNLLKYSPLHIFWAGHEAVILFFILSGFVLSLPYYSKNVKYKTFIIRRICRIYFPYIVAVLFSVLTFELFSSAKIPELSSWFNSLWMTKITFKDLVAHFFLIGYFNVDAIDSPIWSMVHEMRISIIFPLLMYFILKYDWKTNITIAIFFSFISYVSLFFTHNAPILKSIFETVRYVLMFILGATLAQHRAILIQKFVELRLFNRKILVIIGIFLYTYTYEVYGINIIHKTFINEWATAMGASILIITVLSFNRFLLAKPIQFFGKISYSLYLFHFPVLISTVRVLYGRIPMWSIFVVVFCASVILATLSYRFIEIPSIAVGRWLTMDKEEQIMRKIA